MDDRPRVLASLLLYWAGLSPAFPSVPNTNDADRVLQAAHSTPEKIAALRTVYDRAVEQGWATSEGLEWLDSEEDVLRRAPHLEGGEIMVGRLVCVILTRQRDLQSFPTGMEGLVEQQRWMGSCKRCDRLRRTRAAAAWREDDIWAVGNVLFLCTVVMLINLQRKGTFKEPIFAADGKTCIGVLAADGTRHEADRVVLATGAWSPALIDLKDQCISKVSIFSNSTYHARQLLIGTTTVVLDHRPYEPHTGRGRPAQGYAGCVP